LIAIAHASYGQSDGTPYENVPEGVRHVVGVERDPIVSKEQKYAYNAQNACHDEVLNSIDAADCQIVARVLWVENDEAYEENSDGGRYDGHVDVGIKVAKQNRDNAHYKENHRGH